MKNPEASLTLIKTTAALIDQYSSSLMPDDLNNAFWDFACQSYALEGVEKALLELQDQYDQNICFTLWLIWSAQQKQPIDIDQVNQCKHISETIDKDCINPIRQSRIKQKELGINLAYYEQTKALELALEQQLIAILYKCNSQPTYKSESLNVANEPTLLQLLNQVYNAKTVKPQESIKNKIIAVQQLTRI